MKCEYQAAMYQVHMPKDCETRILAAMERRKAPRRRLSGAVVLAAAVVVLLCGSALAVSYRAGVLEFFFRGDTSVVEPYVQHPNSVSNENYRLSVDDVLFDGRTVYAVATIEGLNPQAVEDLKSNRIIAETHLEDWGQGMVDGLLESGSAGPDTFFIQGAKTIGCSELPAPDESSRSWTVHGTMGSWYSGDSFAFGTNIMGRDTAVCVEPDMIEPLILTPDKEIPFLDEEGRVACTEFAVYMTGVSGTFYVDQGNMGDLLPLMTLSVTIKLQDGTVLNSDGLGLGYQNGETLWEKPSITVRFNYQFEMTIDPTQITAVSVNGVELMP